MVNQIAGDDGSNTLQGTSDADLIYGFDPNGPTANVSAIAAMRVVAGLDQPVAVVAAPGDQNHLFLVERSGIISVLDFRSGATRPFLDISSTVTTVGEGGLLGLAFDPGYAQNGLFYVNVTDTNDDTQIRRYIDPTRDSAPADPASRVDLLTIDQPAGLTNHKGGWLGFGPDGYLYVPTGDGGGGGDPSGNAQNPLSLLGKLLRIDVRGDGFPDDAARNYAIPSDNPFVGSAGVAPEIWALGLRNPFRASFDRSTGTLFIGDVGQSAMEEIDIGAAGANYGWNVFEGTLDFRAGPLGPGTLTAPIHSYDRGVGQTVIGGAVYRGGSDGLQGQYFFADFIAGKVFTLRDTGAGFVATDRTAQIVPTAGTIDAPTAFGEDAVGNLYLVDFDGELFRLVPSTNSADLGDTIDGQGGNDAIHAGGGNDMVAGGSGDDALYGANGNDRLTGGPGADFLVGGPGQNTAVYAGASTSYAVTLQAIASAFTVRDRSGADGTDTLAGIQQLEFTDRTVDISWAPKAAGLSAAQLGNLIEVYVASFDRAPDALGLQYWGARLADGMALKDIAKSFFVQPEAAAFYPPTQTTPAFVTTVYDNVLGRGPDDAGLAYWTAELQSGRVSKDGFLLDLISGAKAFAGSADALTLANKQAVGGHFALSQGLSDVEWSKTVMAGVSSAPSSVASANMATDNFAAMAASGSTSELVIQIVGIAA